MGVGVEVPETLETWQGDTHGFEGAFRHETAKEGARETVFLEAWHQPAHEVIMITFGEDAHHIVIGT